MINLPKIIRLSRAGDFDRVFEESLRSARPIPLPVRLRLSAPHSVAASAIGLALQRVVDLTYMPTDVTRELLTALIDRQQPDGSFGTLGATAVAAAALAAVTRQVDSLSGLRAGQECMTAAERDQLRAAAVAACEALASACTLFGGRIGARLGMDPIDAAIVLWQAAPSPRLAAAADVDRLLESAERAGLFHDRSAAPLLERFTSIRHTATTDRPSHPAPFARRHRSAHAA
ncbi:MAG TPA: hypothetical protein VG797_03945 [Phycisphaerales bacterium]|nr:hypothetical protein [Phycisphaerales bacterium]